MLLLDLLGFLTEVTVVYLFETPRKKKKHASKLPTVEVSLRAALLVARLS